MNLLERLGLRSVEGLTPGTHRFDGLGELAGHRFHLRVDSTRKGVLLVDASRMLFLNGTALDHVRCMLEGWDADQAYAFMRRRYKGMDKLRFAPDHEKVHQELLRFVEGDLDEMQHSVSMSPSIGADDLPSPYRMDMALTYKCQNDCGHCYNEDRKVEEMPVERWLEVIDKLWTIGIPHVVFTGGEPTLVPFLRDLVARSEHNGQITGLVTNGRALGKEGYLRDLVATGLDHVQVTVLSHRASVHDAMAGQEGAWEETVAGLKVAIAEDLYVSTNTTIMSENLGDIEETMRFLVGLGVENISFNGVIRSGKGKEARSVTYPELEDVLGKIVAIAEETGTNLTWYTPTPYCEFNPLEHGFGIKQCTACSLAMAIEPDGSVLPCQSYYEPLGNILADRWPNIWEHSLCREVREREYLPGKCVECDLSDVCGGGCPLSIKEGDYQCLDRLSSM